MTAKVDTKLQEVLQEDPVSVRALAELIIGAEKSSTQEELCNVLFEVHVRSWSNLLSGLEFENQLAARLLCTWLIQDQRFVFLRPTIWSLPTIGLLVMVCAQQLNAVSEVAEARQKTERSVWLAVLRECSDWLPALARPEVENILTHLPAEARADEEKPAESLEDILFLGQQVIKHHGHCVAQLVLKLYPSLSWHALLFYRLSRQALTTRQQLSAEEEQLIAQEQHFGLSSRQAVLLAGVVQVSDLSMTHIESFIQTYSVPAVLKSSFETQLILLKQLFQTGYGELFFQQWSFDKQKKLVTALLPTLHTLSRSSRRRCLQWLTEKNLLTEDILDRFMAVSESSAELLVLRAVDPSYTERRNKLGLLSADSYVGGQIDSSSHKKSMRNERVVEQYVAELYAAGLTPDGLRQYVELQIVAGREQWFPLCIENPRLTYREVCDFVRCGLQLKDWKIKRLTGSPEGDEPTTEEARSRIQLMRKLQQLTSDQELVVKLATKAAAYVTEELGKHVFNIEQLQRLVQHYEEQQARDLL